MSTTILVDLRTRAADLTYPRPMGERRWLALDGLRGIAVLMVIADHAGFTTNRAVGSAGVTIFFVLSGFLITHVILSARRRGEWSMGRFMMARAVRLVPALLVMEVVVLAWWLLAGREFAEAARQMLMTTLYIQNVIVLSAEPGALMEHTWSLATEEQFYLLWPLVLPLVMKARSPMAVVVVGVLASMVIRIGLTFLDYSAWAYSGLASNAFGLLLGCMLVVEPVHIRSSRLQRFVAVACLAAVISIALSLPTPVAYILVPILVSLAAVALVASSVPGVPLFELTWLRFVGRISYALYLWHWPVLVLLDQTYGGTSALPALVLTFALAVASTLWLEEPLRRRWRARQTTPVQALVRA